MYQGSLEAFAQFYDKTKKFQFHVKKDEAFANLDLRYWVYNALNQGKIRSL